jgi:hypothetical protein
VSQVLAFLTRNKNVFLKILKRQSNKRLGEIRVWALVYALTKNGY